MIILDLGEFKRGRLWINEMPNIKMEVTSSFEEVVEVNNYQQWEEKVITLELLLAPRDISNYALLGVKYNPTSTNMLNIQVNATNFNGSILQDNIALLTDEVHMGIPQAYVSSIISTAKEKAKELNFPAGSLIFEIGAHGYVGSSKVAFAILTKVLMGLISKNMKDIFTEELNEMVLNLLKSFFP